MLNLNYSFYKKFVKNYIALFSSLWYSYLNY